MALYQSEEPILTDRIDNKNHPPMHKTNENETLF